MQDVKANAADPNGLVDAKLDDRHIVVGAFAA